MSVFTKVLRAGEGKKVRRLAELVPLINDLEPEMEALGDDELAPQDGRVQGAARRRARRLDDLLVEAYAVVREAAWRVLGQRHFDVQLMGGMALHFGWIAEMKTGEGKTLVSTLPVYLNALDGGGVHVVTVNDYLATRDAEWMGRVHRWLGLTVGRIGSDIDDPVGEAGRLRGRHHLRDQQRVRLRLPARQHGPLARDHGPAGPRLRHRRRGRLHPDRRGPDAAHHLGPGRRGGPALLPVRLHRPHARRATSTTRSTRRSRPSSRSRRASRRSRRRSASRTSTTPSRSTTSTS